MPPSLPGSPALLGRRGRVLLVVAVLGVAAYFALGLSPAGLVPTEGGRGIASEFVGAALHPAVDYEAVDVPASAPPFLIRVLIALRRTVVFATAAMSLAVIGGLVLGFLASGSWWARLRAERRSGSRAPWRLAAGVQWSTRLLLAGMRSVHELLWALLFLAAFGLNTASAVLAIAIPYAGTLGKVFSEMLDEARPEAAEALQAAGAAPLHVFLFGRLPRALPDMAAYAFYRFECAVRSSAVLGFFGYETLGYYLRASFNELHLREVWTYLYAMIALVLLLEAWSAVLRRRFVA